MAGLTDVKRAAGGSAAGVEEATIKATFDGIAKLMKEGVAGEKVIIQGFGTFTKTHREARECPNPQKPGEKIMSQAKDVITFKMSPSVDLTPPKAATGRRGK